MQKKCLTPYYYDGNNWVNHKKGLPKWNVNVRNAVTNGMHGWMSRKPAHGAKAMIGGKMATQRSKEQYSRQKARAYMKGICPWISEDHHVHHINGDPLDNTPTNLCVISGSLHHSYHMKNYWVNNNSRLTSENLERSLRTLNSLLVVYNTFMTGEGSKWDCLNCCC